MGLLPQTRAAYAARMPVAIFSLHHSIIGKATQRRPNTAAAHVRYITRPSACSRSFGARLPTAPGQLTVWMNAQEAADRKNGRVCDKLMLALPRELDADQRAALITAFAEEVTRTRAAWFAAVHDRGKDARNPHCHLVIRDRDPETGKRIMNTSERGSTQQFREQWSAACNRALAAAQRQERVTHLSLEAQGLKRTATIHEGVRARRLSAENRPVRSRAINARNAPTARRRTRQIDYPGLDRGHSRMAYNAAIVRQNEQIYWAAIDAAAAADAVAAREREAAAQRIWALAGTPSPSPSQPVSTAREAWLARERAARSPGLARGYDDDDDD
jgi:hypothetical protein